MFGSEKNWEKIKIGRKDVRKCEEKKTKRKNEKKEKVKKKIFKINKLFLYNFSKLFYLFSFIIQRLNNFKIHVFFN